MNKSILILLTAIVFCACGKESMHFSAKGFIGIDENTAIYLTSGYEADMEAIAFGKNNWHLFSKEQKTGEIEINDCSVYISSYPVGTRINQLCLYDVPDYGFLWVSFEDNGSGNYSVSGTHSDRPAAETVTQVSGTATVNRFHFNSSATYLDLDVVLHLDKEVRIVFKGVTPNDGIAWAMD